MNNNTVTQMAAMSAAMRMLLAGNRLGKPADLCIAASSGITGQLIEAMMSHAAEGRSTLLLIFRVEDNTALLEKIMIVDASKKGEIIIGGGKFVQHLDGGFAIRSIDRAKPYEYCLRAAGRRLVRRAVEDDSQRAAMEMRGLQQLIAKAATSECQEEAQQLSVSFC